MATAPKKTETPNDGYKLALQISKKGAVQLNGLRRFPVTLYADEWDAIFARTDKIKQFIKDNRGKLKTKEEAGEEDSEKFAI